jgi:Alw26I/Eco31I/Esp3I family type II restriction m6 adenine DNA methyltransferase
MSAYQTIESILLSRVDATLEACTHSLNKQAYEARLQILEAVASKLGGFNLTEYFSRFKIKPLFNKKEFDSWSSILLNEIQQTDIHPALALSALAREPLATMTRKKNGAYHTDFRLAKRVAEQAACGLTYKSKAIDPACGSGILLTALTLEVCGSDKKKIAYWLKKGVYAADLSKNSLRGCLLSLASLTSDLDALKEMSDKWYCGDSLLTKESTWKKMSPSGFDAVIGNPPWEKIKLSKHEFLTSNGESRHYGSDTSHADASEYQSSKNKIWQYSRNLAAKYPELIQGEADLYIAFTELFYRLCKPGGQIAAILPGGLIRSQGTGLIRRKLLSDNSSISISILDNKARFFEIDSRFKFLLVSLRKLKKSEGVSSRILLLHERGNFLDTEIYGEVTLNKKQLFAIRKDFSIPEVRSKEEWRVFEKIAANAESWEVNWPATFCREVDMTKERPYFKSRNPDNYLPLIEGRMINQFRFGSKVYMSGTGRRAVWKVQPIGDVRIQPQFWINPKKIAKCGFDRTRQQRVGFCDITGQTNERSLMAAIIPPGVACGNKVPTILFENDIDGDRLYVWTAIANSFAFDWMLRRILTTTVNYFLLQSIPLPKIVRNGLPWKTLVRCSKQLMELQAAGNIMHVVNKIASLRAEIDAEVAIAYGLSLEDIAVIFQDFPIIDKNQPPIPSEQRSTITRDMVMATMAKRLGHSPKLWELRISYSRASGALAYVPSEIGTTQSELEDIQIVHAHGKCI